MVLEQNHRGEASPIRPVRTITNDIPEPEMLVREDLAAGRLQAVLPDFSIPQGIAHAAFPSRRGMVPAVRALLDALVNGFTSCTEAGFDVV